jgi:hypothetical protein
MKYPGSREKYETQHVNQLFVDTTRGSHSLEYVTVARNKTFSLEAAQDIFICRYNIKSVLKLKTFGQVRTDFMYFRYKC